MQIRFGYVAMALLLHHGSPNKTVTYTNLIKIPEREDQLNKLRRLTKENLDCLLRVLKYNIAHGIHVFRITSKLVPLATHPLTQGWNYIDEFIAEFQQLGDYIKRNDMRISAHPDHFTLLNSPRESVVTASIENLSYHHRIFAAMGLDRAAKLVLHIGGSYQDKPAAMERFSKNFDRLPQCLKERIVLENDDKIFNAKDTLCLCQTLNIPMVVDIHHHTCCNQGEKIKTLWPGILNTWTKEIPKIHFSSPRDAKNERAHADYINSAAFYSFFQEIKEFNRDFDVMIEAKQKDKALLKLLEELKCLKDPWKIKAATLST